MASIFDEVDMSDPCVVWPKLDEVLNRLLVGESVVRSRFGEEEIQFSAVNISALKTRISELKAACAAKQTGRPRRHAIRAGFKRY